MIEYDSHSRELLLDEYRKHHRLADIRIVNNQLQELQLAGVKLEQVELGHCYLNRSDFQGLQASALVVQQCDLREIQWTGGTQEQCGYEDNLMLKADFTGSRFFNLALKNCVAHSIRFNGCHLVHCDFYACEMDRARLARGVFMQVNFESGPKGSVAGLRKATLTDSIFVDCLFRNQDLSGSDCSGASFIHCDFEGALLEGVDLASCSFTACRFSGQDQNGKKGTDHSILNCF